MIINHNMNAMTANRYSAKNNALAGKSMEKLSSGLRITKAADDAAGLTVSEKMRAQIRGLDQAARNIQDGISLIQTAEGALNEISDILVRMKELSIQRASGTYNAADQGNIDAEATALTAEMANILSKTEFNETALVFDGSVTFNIAIDDSATTLAVLIDDVDTDTAAATVATTGTIDTAITTVNAARANLGALQNRLEHAHNNVSTTSENTQAAESRIRDVDMAAEMVKLSKQNILAQAAQSMLAQANQAPQNVLQLLR